MNLMLDKIIIINLSRRSGGGQTYLDKQTDKISRLISKPIIIENIRDIIKYSFKGELITGKYLVYNPSNYCLPLVPNNITLYQNVKNYGVGINKDSKKDVIKYLILRILTKLSTYISKKNIYVSHYIKSLKFRKTQKDILIHSGAPTPRRYNTHKDNTFLIVSSGMMEHKNIGLTVEAINDYLLNYQYNYHIKLVGHVDRKWENVDYLEYLKHSELMEEYWKSRIYISASSAEAFPLTPHESMAMGTPCILSDIPPHREVAGNAALYFKPNDKEDLTNKIDKLLNDKELYDEMVKRGYEQIKRYSWEKNAEQLLQVFEEVANPRIKNIKK